MTSLNPGSFLGMLGLPSRILLLSCDWTTSAIPVFSLNLAERPGVSSAASPSALPFSRCTWKEWAQPRCRSTVTPAARGSLGACAVCASSSQAAPLSAESSIVKFPSAPAPGRTPAARSRGELQRAPSGEGRVLRFKRPARSAAAVAGPSPRYTSAPLQHR